MSVLIKDMEMPKSCSLCPFCFGANNICPWTREYANSNGRHKLCPLVPVPKHGRLIDADALRAKMYHEAFETDTPMQKWDSGCWIRYKLFETTEESAPTIIPAEEGE